MELMSNVLSDPLSPLFHHGSLPFSLSPLQEGVGWGAGLETMNFVRVKTSSSCSSHDLGTFTSYLFTTKTFSLMKSHQPSPGVDIVQLELGENTTLICTGDSFTPRRNVFYNRNNSAESSVMQLQAKLQVTRSVS